jgi:hypothetical protein
MNKSNKVIIDRNLLEKIIDGYCVNNADDTKLLSLIGNDIILFYQNNDKKSSFGRVENYNFEGKEQEIIELLKFKERSMFHKNHLEKIRKLNNGFHNSKNCLVCIENYKKYIEEDNPKCKICNCRINYGNFGNIIEYNYKFSYVCNNEKCITESMKNF